MTCNCDVDPPDFWHEVIVRARTGANRCCECHELIEPGDTYMRITMVYQGRWDHFIVCEYCQLDWLQLVELGYCRLIGGLAEVLEWVYE